MKKWFIVFKTRRHGFSMKYGMNITEWELQNIIINIHPILFCKQHKEDGFKFSSDFNKITRKNSKRKKDGIFYDEVILLFYDEVPQDIEITDTTFEW